MRSGCCCTVSLTTSSTCFVCSYPYRCAPHKSKRCAFSCSRSGRVSAKQLVASAFTWPAAGLFKISSKLSATPLRLSRPFDNPLSGKGQAQLSRKTVPELKTKEKPTYIKVDFRARSFPPHQCAFCATILASDELTRLGAFHTDGIGRRSHNSSVFLTREACDF